jgi:hypothetical protein
MGRVSALRLFAYFMAWYAIVVGIVNSCYGTRKIRLGDEI